jgi:hypothetical protein
MASTSFEPLRDFAAGVGGFEARRTARGTPAFADTIAVAIVYGRDVESR